MNYLLLILFLIVFEAFYEGMKIRGWYAVSEWAENIYLAGVTLMSLAWIAGIQVLHSEYVPFWKLIISYLFIRFALFDLVLNLFADLRWFYIGRTKMFDRFFRWLIEKGRVAVGLIWFARFILLCIALAWVFNYGQ